VGDFSRFPVERKLAAGLARTPFHLGGRSARERIGLPNALPARYSPHRPLVRNFTQSDHRFHLNPISDFRAKRSPISSESDHGFHVKPITDRPA